MKITDDMIAEDEMRWHARDIVMELGYCSSYIKDRKNLTNDDLRFYAFLMREARAMLEEQGADHALTERVRRGEVVKHVGDVVMFNRDWYMKHRNREAPAVDVVLIVRCKDCKHWERYENTAGCGYCHCKDTCFEYGEGYTFNPVREPDFFCANGERKEQP